MIGERLEHPVDRLIIFIRERRFLNELLYQIILILTMTSDSIVCCYTQSLGEKKSAQLKPPNTNSYVKRNKKMPL